MARVISNVDRTPEALQYSKNKKKRALDAEYQRVLERGVTYNGTNWTATDKARDTLMELLEVARDLGQAVTILDANGAVYQYGEADLNSLRIEGAKYRQAARENRLTLHAQIDAATTHDELDAIDPTSGWPE